MTDGARPKAENVRKRIRLGLRGVDGALELLAEREAAGLPQLAQARLELRHARASLEAALRHARLT